MIALNEVDTLGSRLVVDGGPMFLTVGGIGNFDILLRQLTVLHRLGLHPRVRPIHAIKTLHLPPLPVSPIPSLVAQAEGQQGHHSRHNGLLRKVETILITVVLRVKLHSGGPADAPLGSDFVQAHLSGVG